MAPKISFKDKDIISIDEFSREEIEYILTVAASLEKKPRPTLLAGKILATLFFEPSTRTRLSFTSAMMRLGGQVLGVASTDESSRAKGESVWDAAKMAQSYADVIAMRHPLEGAARVAAEASDKPVINGGDGANQHPTQTLLDLYSILKTQRKLDGLRIAMVGDLKYGRTVHSLATALSHFNVTISFVAPQSLAMPKAYLRMLDDKKIPHTEYAKVEDVVKDADILYMTRIQKERFGDPLEYEKVKDVYVLTKKMLKKSKPSMRVLHPLPRVNEIARDVDTTNHAYYFEQAANGVYIREALLALVLGKL